MDSKKITFIVLAFVFLVFAGYMAYKFIQTIPPAIELQNAINEANNPNPSQNQTQREDAQQIFNNLLEGNNK